jgi:hypothetical protein
MNNKKGRFQAIPEAYTPGTCNIGKYEISKRMRNGYAGLILSGFYLLVVQYMGLTRQWKLLLFIPLYYAVISFYQARRRFCVAFGMMGIFNLSEKKSLKNVLDKQYLKLDRIKAIRMVFVCFLITAAIVMAYYLLPV